MKEKLHEEDKEEKKNIYKSISFALTLPSSVIGTTVVVKELIEKNFISYFWGLTIIMFVICGSFVMIITYALKYKK